LNAVHDVSDGGLLVAIAEMAMASGMGAELEAAPIPAHGFWFGEDQARYVLGVPAGKAAKVATRARGAGIPIRWLGTTGGDPLTLAGARPLLVGKLFGAFEGGRPGCMSFAGRQRRRGTA